jgi:mannose-6-phosphate isomerase
MGAHASAPSRINRGKGERSLAEVISADPLTKLGPACLNRFGPELPFLLKVLAADRPLSVQVHPTLAQARADFADEETRGIPVEARYRNYKDASHKPELICALSEFDAFRGFRAPATTAKLLEVLDAPSLVPWIDTLRHEPDGLRTVVADALSGCSTRLASSIAEVTRSLERVAVSAGPHAEACAMYALAAHEFPGDPGIILLLLLNHVRLEPGQSLSLRHLRTCWSEALAWRSVGVLVLVAIGCLRC